MSAGPSRPAVTEPGWPAGDPADLADLQRLAIALVELAALVAQLAVTAEQTAPAPRLVPTGWAHRRARRRT